MTCHDEMVYAARARGFGARALAMAAGPTHDELVAEELRYVPVNNDGRFGRRAFLEISDPRDAKNTIRATIAAEVMPP